ncbi:MAG: hypothetical protein H0V51_04685 [Chloroflexi bacterium]|nr:hypothetical protein [Chloroflexota bacterium]
MRGWLVGAVAILLASTLAGAGGAPVGAEEDGGGEGWARLGPPGPQRVGIVTVAPGWPEDRVILAVRGEDVVRTSRFWSARAKGERPWPEDPA